MNTQNTRTRSIEVWFFGALIALMAGWFIFSTNSVKAVQDSEDKPPSWGVAPGQSVRLSVANCTNDQGFSIDWRFLDNLGRAIAQTPEPHLVPPGRIASFDINGDALPTTRDHLGRIQMRAVVTSLDNPDAFKHFGQVSVEVVDNATGRSSIFISSTAAKACTNNL
jgi:hypothetical protein